MSSRPAADGAPLAQPSFRVLRPPPPRTVRLLHRVEAATYGTARWSLISIDRLPLCALPGTSAPVLHLGPQALLLVSPFAGGQFRSSSNPRRPRVLRPSHWAWPGTTGWRSAITFIPGSPLSCASLRSPARSVARARLLGPGRGRARQALDPGRPRWSRGHSSPKSTDLACRPDRPPAPWSITWLIPPPAVVQLDHVSVVSLNRNARWIPGNIFRRSFSLGQPVLHRNLLASRRLAVTAPACRPRTSCCAGSGQPVGSSIGYSRRLVLGPARSSTQRSPSYSSPRDPEPRTSREGPGCVAVLDRQPQRADLGDLERTGRQHPRRLSFRIDGTFRCPSVQVDARSRPRC